MRAHLSGPCRRQAGRTGAGTEGLAAGVTTVVAPLSVRVRPFDDADASTLGIERPKLPPIPRETVATTVEGLLAPLEQPALAVALHDRGRPDVDMPHAVVSSGEGEGYRPGEDLLYAAK